MTQNSRRHASKQGGAGVRYLTGVPPFMIRCAAEPFTAVRGFLFF
jgi:hypothetical protein